MNKRLFKESFFNDEKETHIFLICILSMAVYCLYRGQDIAYDLFCYHFYNGFSLANWRINTDIHPAHMQSYHTAIFDLPLYYIIKVFNLPSYIYGIFSGLIQGMSWFFSYKIFYFFIRPMEEVQYKKIWSFLFATAGTLTAIYLDIVGITYGDAYTVPFYIGGIYYFIRQNESHELKDLFMSGLLIGMAVGLKVINIGPLVGHVVFSFIILKKNIRAYAIFLLSLALGFLILGGFWHLYLFIKFQNPLFPLFNAFFKSPWMNIYNFTPRDSNHLEPNPWEFLQIPFELLNIKREIINHYPIKEARLLTMMFVFIASSLSFLFKKRTFSRDFKWIAFFSLSWILNYFLWIKTGIVYRYFIIGDQLIFLIIFFLLKEIIKNKKILFATMSSMAIFFLSYQYSGYYDLVPWQKDNYFGIKNVEELEKIKNSSVLLMGPDLNSYLIPYFDKSNTFIRIQGTMDSFNMPSQLFKSFISDRVKSLKGKTVYALFNTKEDGTLGWDNFIFVNGHKTTPGLLNTPPEILKEFNYEIIASSCKKIESFFHHIRPIELCLLKEI